VGLNTYPHVQNRYRLATRHNSHVKRSILAAILAATFSLAPLAHADTVPIGNPYTDTFQLWNSITSSIEYLAQETTDTAQSALSALQHLASAVPQSKPPTAAATSPEQSGSLAAAVASFESASNAPATSTEPAPVATSYGTTNSLFVKSADSEPATSDQTTNSQDVKSAELSTAQNPSPTTQSAISAPTSATTGALIAPSNSNFVTEPELTAQLLELSNSLTSKINSAQFLTVPGWAASQQIGQLNGTTITNANLTASEIPALDYLSLNGGTLSGALSVPTLDASTTNYGVITSTNSSTTDATSTNLFSTFGNFTTGLISTISGTTLTYTAASTTNFSNYGTASFGGTATSSFNSAGALTLAAPLAVTSGGTGQISFGQGWVSSNGTTLTASTSPTVYYITATSTTATSTFAGNLNVSGLSNFGGLQLSGNKTYAGASSDANSIFYMPGSALFGTASAAPNGIISPFNLYISGDQVNTTTNGNGNLIDFSIDAAVGNGHTGGREAFQSYLNIVGTPSTTPGTAGYVGGQFMLRGSANLTGTGGSFSNYHGGAFASNADVYLTSGATFYGLVNAEEFDVTVPTGASTANKYGISIVKGSNDAVRGAYDDAALSIDDQDNASDPGWHYGISFGSYSAQWAFATDSTLIMAQQRQAGPASPDVALNGVDFRNVTFGGHAFASPGFSVDGSGNILGNNLYASSTSFVTFDGQGAGAAVIASATSSNQTSGEYATALGYQALGNATSSAYESVAVGYDALLSSATVSSANANNTAIGFEGLKSNSSGADNVAVGNIAMWANTSGNNNTAIGATSMQFNTTGFSNTAMGRQALDENTSGTSNTGIGVLALLNTQTGSNNTAVGLGAGEGVSSNSFANNSLFGANAGFALSTGGNNNVFIGKDAASTTASGADNIVLGYGIDLPVTNGSNQLDIGNLIYATAVNGALSTVSTGNVGVGTTTPYSRLEVWGADAASTSAFLVANNASTTEFNVLDNGNATLSGSLTQNSDERLKTNIQSLGASSSLSLIDSLNPVTFNWIDPNKGTTPQLGFIAQQVLPLFPNLVSTSSPTALTPDGTLSLNYIGLISPIVSAMQALSTELTSIENTIAGFATVFHTQELCVGSTCVTPAQFQTMVAAASASQASVQENNSGTDDSPSDSATDTPPEIRINGDNPAIVQVGDTYNDLGATITGPTADLNLGITTYVNGAETDAVQIDTSAAATDTIDYVATDQNGLTSTSSRTVIIEGPSIAPTDDASSSPEETAITTDATTTAQ
jgi:hypothetical protein